jgi:hypothetical protein
MNTGSILAGRPSLGAWVNYGLGTENDSLPAFVVMEDNPGKVVNGPKNWGAGFMPAVYQGTPLEAGDQPIRYLTNPKDVSDDRQRKKLALLAELNRHHAASRPEQSELEARIASYELAFKMQAEAPEAVDLSQETAETRAMYGLDQKETASFGRMCLLARRLVERGVRFVQVYSDGEWDAHADLAGNHTGHCAATDRPIDALLTDLRSRGLLESTLVIWGAEFGRMPVSQGSNGRDHNPHGFLVWMTGAGIKGGASHGETDEIGHRAVVDRTTVHDLHATMLHLLGIEHERLTYLHNGRRYRLTDVAGNLLKKILA